MIFCIGSINVDFIFESDRWPSEHEKRRADDYICVGGGSAANTAAELSRLGFDVSVVGGIGCDALGKIAIRSLVEAGVCVDRVIRRGDWKTGCAAIRSAGNTKSILTAGRIDLQGVLDSLQTLRLQKGDHLHFSWMPSSSLHTRLQQWRQQGVSLSWETNGRMSMSTAEMIDIVFMNDDERQIYQSDGFITDEWIKSADNNMNVITLGGAGAELYSKGNRFFCEAIKTNIVDRTGGGDAFDAGFVAAWLNGNELDACLESGLKSAATIIGMLGPRCRGKI